MNDIELAEYLAERMDSEEEIILADGFAEAFIGIGYIMGQPIASYSYDKCIEILMKRDSMSYEDAEEFFDFNVAGSYVGKSTPIFIDIVLGKGS